MDIIRLTEAFKRSTKSFKEVAKIFKQLNKVQKQLAYDVKRSSKIFKWID